MVSKSKILCALALLVIQTGCSLPWAAAPVQNELNLAFVLDRNQVVLTNATLDRQAARLVLASGTPKSLLDANLAGRLHARSGHVLRLGGRMRTRLQPAVADLHGVADMLLGSEVWGRRTLVLDYARGLATLYDERPPVGDMTTYTYQGLLPRIHLKISGADTSAVVDTSVPDTLILPMRYAPRGAGLRGKVDLEVAGLHFGGTEVRFADVTEAHVGNRILSRFLVTIDYGSGTVSLWPVTVK